MSVSFVSTWTELHNVVSISKGSKLIYQPHGHPFLSSSCSLLTILGLNQFKLKYYLILIPPWRYTCAIVIVVSEPMGVSGIAGLLLIVSCNIRVGSQMAKSLAVTSLAFCLILNDIIIGCH